MIEGSRADFITELDLPTSDGMGTQVRMTEAHLAALLAALSPEQAQRMIATLCNVSADYTNMVDAACEAEADRILEMSDEEMDAELAAHGADPERVKKWGAATGRWIRMICDERELRRKADAELAELRPLAKEALDARSDLERRRARYRECSGLNDSMCPRCGNCFCGEPDDILGDGTNPDCPLHGTRSDHACPPIEDHLAELEGKPAAPQREDSE